MEDADYPSLVFLVLRLSNLSLLICNQKKGLGVVWFLVQGPPATTVVLKVQMHCEACAEEMKKRIQRIKGVELAEPDIKRSEVAVKGVFEPGRLVEYVYRRTGKHAALVNPLPHEKEEDGKGGEKDGGPLALAATEECGPLVVDVKRNQYSLWQQ